MKFGSLFTGIGGIDLGLERAGMECIWQVEIDTFCQMVLEKLWPNVERFRNVRECGRENLQSVDLICGGFPCQPHSLAGKRRGEEDDRNLWPEYRRIISELRPRWVLGENVPGIRTTMLDTVLSDLETEGYTAITLDIPALAFDAPHRRHRYFIVAYTEYDGQFAAEIAGGTRARIYSQAREGRAEQPAGSDGSQVGTKDLAYSGQQPKGTTFDRESNQREGNWQSGAGSVRTGSRNGLANSGEDLADSNIKGLQDGRQTGTEVTEGGPAHAESERCGGSWWAVEPDVGRVADGIPSRVDRIRTLGNAVVPQVAEWIGRRIIEADGELQ